MDREYRRALWNALYLLGSTFLSYFSLKRIREKNWVFDKIELTFTN